jgi:(p)ppGpp synthase/HD superfamily hydrolase
MNDTAKRIVLLTNWVRDKHEQQKRKYTGEPYFLHLVAVADMAKEITRFGYEIGLCHDLIEDARVTSNELFEELLKLGYDDEEANYITIRVVDLTDVYTTEAFPNMNRKARKLAEASRLHTISPGAQTVKYCDLINNTESIVQYDPGFARKYLQEKKEILEGMTNGNKEMYDQAIVVMNQALLKLNNEPN